MARKRRSAPPNIHESFSDIALLMLATFVFLLVTILITSRLSETYEAPKLKQAVKALEEQLAKSEADRERLSHDLDAMAGMSVESQMEQALAAVGLSKGKEHKDFDVFVQGLSDLPGTSLHLLVDATGSMHGASDFLIPVLRVIVIRSGKRLDALTWFSDHKAETYQGSMGEIFDQLLQGAPFVGADETIGHAFKYAAEHAPKPSAYLLIGDEPPSDHIVYFNIPSPVFTLPLGRDNPDTTWHYKTLAEKTGGKMLHLTFE